MSTAIPSVETQAVAADGRVMLPQFADATVTVEVVSGDEVRVRRAAVAAPTEEPELDGPLPEDVIPPLSDRDRDLFLSVLENPPKAGPVLRAAIARYKERHG